MTNQYLAMKHLHLTVLPEDQELARMVTVFHNSFAIFVIKVVQGAEHAQLPELSATLASFISGYIQNDRALLAKLGDEDVIWDIYLVFLIEEQIPVKVKVELENDRFYCKKIILPYTPDLPIEEQLHQMIMFKQFADLSSREGDYLAKGEFVSRLLADVGNPQLRNFMQRNDLLKLGQDQMLAKFQKVFKISAGDDDVQS